LAALALRDTESLIELGCGPGDGLRRLLRHEGLGEMVGLDWSEAMLAQAARRNRRALADGRLMLVRGDFACLPFADKSADAILAVNVAYFMTGPTPLREAYRVLRTGGRIVLYATERDCMRRWRFASRHTHRLYDEQRLAAALTDAGFSTAAIDIGRVDAGFGVTGLIARARKEMVRKKTG
jgi:ubiquinone/menaquinone biosynthesis C-methylase UbiE